MSINRRCQTIFFFSGPSLNIIQQQYIRFALPIHQKKKKKICFYPPECLTCLFSFLDLTKSTGNSPPTFPVHRKSKRDCLSSIVLQHIIWWDTVYFICHEFFDPIDIVGYNIYTLSFIVRFLSLSYTLCELYSFL